MNLVMARLVRSLLGLLMGALLLSGCGAFGNEAAQASPTEPAISESSIVRVASGDRFFDIDIGSLVDGSGDTTASAVGTLNERVAGLAVGTADPTNAGIIFDGDEFVLNPSIPGSSPDIDGLLDELLNGNVASLDLPFTSIPAEVSNEDAAEYASELNERVANGLEVSVGGEQDVLSASVLGEATTVEWENGEWVVSIDYEGIADELESMFPDVGSAGGEARFEVEPGEGDEPATVVIVPGEPGTECCETDATVARLVRALTSDVDTAVLTLATADGERGVEWAEDLGIDELVGSFTTRYTAGQDRNINIQRIAELTQGHIIEPGETWSLNERVGRRTTANGFVPAGTIVNGHLTESVGGGISQYATTIFNAAFFAGLEFDSYQAHTIYFSRYPYGREATVSWPAPQLEIHNPTPYGILIWPTTTSNSITVDLYSTKWVDAEQTRQFESTVQVACTRVTSERTRTFLDGTVDVDSVFAIYRAEGIGCDGEPTEDPDAPPTTTTIPGPDGEGEDGDNPDGDPDNENGENVENVPEGEQRPTAPTPTDPANENPQPPDAPVPPGDGAEAPPGPDGPAAPNGPGEANPPPPNQPDEPAAPAPPAPPVEPEPAPNPADEQPAPEAPAAEDIAAPAPDDAT